MNLKYNSLTDLMQKSTTIPDMDHAKKLRDSCETRFERMHDIARDLSVGSGNHWRHTYVGQHIKF